MPRRIAVVILFVAVPLAAVVAVVGSRAGRAPAAPAEIVATIYPLAEFARGTGGEQVTVRTLVPPGVEPHDYEPTPQDVVLIHRARVFIYTGAGVEPWAARVIPTLPASVNAAPATRGLPLVKRDPHVWLDPVLAQQMVGLIGEAMVSADPESTGAYLRGADAMRTQLAALHERYVTGLSQCDRRVLVTTHTAFGYLARRYGLEEIGLTGLAPEAEPGPGTLARLSRDLRARGVRTIFIEPLVSPRAAAALAREIGAQIAVLDPIEGLSAGTPPAASGYLGLMQANLDALRAGLGCR